MALFKLASLYAKHPYLYKKHIQKYSQAKTMYYLISTDPPIFYVPVSPIGWGLATLELVFNYLQDQIAYFILGWWWNIEDTNEVEKIVSLETHHTSQYPKHNLIYLCNTVQQQEIFQKHNLNAVFCNHNCLVDERVFQPTKDSFRIYDAVYDAILASYKRHYLAQKINSIAFIYYENSNVISCFKEVKSLFPYAHYFNETLGENGYTQLTPEKVNQCLNDCRVGLCLSSIEGAMYASIQYLLSGLPVVSTKSKGGRDVFFDPEYALIVDDDPDAVKEGVDAMIRRNLSADSIRSKVLVKVQEHRQVLIRLIQSIYDRENVNRDFSIEWEQIFTNKLFRLQSPTVAIEQLESAKQNL
uniref:Glycosyl transferase family 1 domain-containing protein n=1 Tax=Cyanothece sp. (strain PCC 7425 / ATCC 29141) TaxID=395961 RepID=B8HPX5_CYAP4